jgi:hypothetical protein
MVPPRAAHIVAAERGQEQPDNTLVVLVGDSSKLNIEEQNYADSRHNGSGRVFIG